MNIKSFIFNPIQENTYLLWDEQTREAAVIDAGMYDEEEYALFDQFMLQQQLTLKLCLQTHTHFDHIYGLQHIHEKYDLRPLFHAQDEQIYYAMNDLTARFHIPFNVKLPAAERFLEDNEALQLGGSKLQAILTPGHTPGGLSFYLPQEGLLFSGDTLFMGSIGRYDLPGGDYETEVRSIRERLFTLPDDTKVYPGHGPCTTIGYEKAYNRSVL